MDVEYEASCSYDRLQLVDGHHPTWLGAGPEGQVGRQLSYDMDYYNFYGVEENIIGNFCGSLGNDTETGSMTNGGNSIVRQSISNEMTIIFTSDLDSQRSGFQLTWTGVGDDLRQESSLVISQLT